MPAVRDEQLGAMLRAVRLHRGWRQSDVAAVARLARSRLPGIERGHIDGVSLGVLRRYCEALGVGVELHARWRGGELSRLLDADHAALQESFSRQLSALGWLVRPEVSFSRYGERGRYDLLALHVATNAVLVVEVKTVIADVQDLLGSLDSKVRLASHVVAELGWQRPAAVVPLIVAAARRTNRRRVAEHRSLFARFSLRGRQALAWLRQPNAAVSGALLFASVPNVTPSYRRHAGRQRVRSRAAAPSVNPRRRGRPSTDSQA